MNSWAIERFFNEEKGRKNETNCIINFQTFTRRIYNFILQKTKVKKTKLLLRNIYITVLLICINLPNNLQKHEKNTSISFANYFRNNDF